MNEEKVFAIFAKKFPQKIKSKISILSQNEIDKYFKVWNKEFTSKRGRYKKIFFDTIKEQEYKNCLFTIYKYYWNTENGFQINMKNIGNKINKSYRTVDRMILLFIECGLLKRVHNYLVGKQTYFYQKNISLFNHIFKTASNEYNDWLYKNKIKTVNNDEYKKSEIIQEITNSSNKSNINNINNIYANVDTNKKTRKSKVNKIYKSSKDDINNNDIICSNVDMNKKLSLYNKIIKEFLPIIDKLNKNQHEDLKIDFGLHFDNKGNFSGRSFSYFCLTLNENKLNNSDNSMEKRKEFLNRVGCSDYHEVYDIKSEVPRTTILSNYGKWKNDNYDIYNEIIKESGVQEITRDIIKELYMRFNFGVGTIKQRFNYYRNYRISVLKKEYGMNNNTARNFYETRLENDLEYTYDEWVLLGNAIEKIQGKSYGNIIFWWTSLIQIYTIYQIYKEKKIRVYNVYDNFYSNSKISKNYILKTVEKSANYIYEKYIKKYLGENEI